MKTFLSIVVTLLHISSATSQSTTRAPFTCPDNNNGFYPLPECFHMCCSSYYVCNQGTAYLAECSTAGYVFNPSTTSCVDPVDCEEHTFECPPEANGFFPEPECPTTKCCADYEVCVDGVDYHAVCQNNTVFDVSYSSCLALELCFACPTPDGRFSDPACPQGTCCNQYKVCTSGTPSNANCPPGQVFDISNRRCTQTGQGGC